MSNNPDDFLFADEELPKLDDIEVATFQRESWKVLIVDDEKDVHDVTKLFFVILNTKVNRFNF